jgi:hypothetical protein
MAINSRLLACKDEIGQALYYAKLALRVDPYFQVLALLKCTTGIKVGFFWERQLKQFHRESILQGRAKNSHLDFRRKDSAIKVTVIKTLVNELIL